MRLGILLGWVQIEQQIVIRLLDPDAGALPHIVPSPGAVKVNGVTGDCARLANEMNKGRKETNV